MSQGGWRKILSLVKSLLEDLILYLGVVQMMAFMKALL